MSRLETLAARRLPSLGAWSVSSSCSPEPSSRMMPSRRKWQREATTSLQESNEIGRGLGRAACASPPLSELMFKLAEPMMQASHPTTFGWEVTVEGYGVAGRIIQ